MSAAPALLAPDELPASLPESLPEPGSAAPGRAAPRLRVIPARAPRMGRTAFGLLVGGILAVGLLVALLLNTVLAQGAFAIHELERRASDLEVQQQELQRQVAALGAPETLNRRARALGMVETPSTAFLRLRDGKVRGQAQRAGGVPRPLPDRVPTVVADPAVEVPGAGRRPVTTAPGSTAATPEEPTTSGDGAVAVEPAGGAASSGESGDAAVPVSAP